MSTDEINADKGITQDTPSRLKDSSFEPVFVKVTQEVK